MVSPAHPRLLGGLDGMRGWILRLEYARKYTPHIPAGEKQLLNLRVISKNR